MNIFQLMTKRSILPGPLYKRYVLIVHCTLITMYVESLISPRGYTLNITIVDKVYHIKTSWVHIMNHVSTALSCRCLFVIKRL